MKTFSRDSYLNIIETAIEVNKLNFALEASLNWLAVYPGDLKAGFLYAKGLIGKGNSKQAIPILEGLCLADPEYYPAVFALCSILDGDPSTPTAEITPNKKLAEDLKTTINPETYYTWLYVLRSKNHRYESKLTAKVAKNAAIWGKYLRHAKLDATSDDFDKSERKIILALGETPQTPLVHLFHLKHISKSNRTPITAKLNLAQHYHKLWPTCLPITLIVANWMMEGAEQDLAVKLLHQVMARDISGQVAQRLWGIHHPYRSLWPENLELDLSIQIPAEVAMRLGNNQIPSRVPNHHQDTAINNIGQNSLPGFLFDDVRTLDPKQGKSPLTKPRSGTLENRREKTPEDIEIFSKIHKEFENLAKGIKQPDLTKLDGRYPVYVIYSLHTNLEKKFGSRSAKAIIREANNLVDIITERSQRDENFNWSARVFLPDSIQSTKRVGLKPVDRIDPWSLKLALVDLDNALAKRGEMIGALLIVGGPDIVPFHHLPNPVDDPDDFVPSDNPYGTKDENYFILDWPVGRLPDGRGTDPNLLIHNIRSVQGNHLHAVEQASWLQNLIAKVLAYLKRNRSRGIASLGYSAEVWKSASQSVYQPIGDPRKLVTSPPLGINGNRSSQSEIPQINKRSLGYFNLHGLIDTSEWYGQSNPTSPASNPDYPIALRPDDIRGRTRLNRPNALPEVVFSEACYGAHIDNKSVEEALSLTFLYAGNTAFIGSTSMSYGTVNPPLIAADLIGYSFWKYLREGLMIGEALRQAKFHLAHVMNRRQGYLDGEDQKTLISFLLYGDPLSHYLNPSITHKGITRLIESSDPISTICDRSLEKTNGKNLPVQDIEFLKDLVTQYLPGMGDAQIVCGSERAICHGEGHVCPTSQLDGNRKSNSKPTRKVFTLSKKFTKNSHQHQQIARITLDERGSVVKFVVSR